MSTTPLVESTRSGPAVKKEVEKMKIEWTPELLGTLKKFDLGCYHTVSDQVLLDDQEAQQVHDTYKPDCDACRYYAEEVEGYVLRFTRHPVTSEAIQILRRIYGKRVAVGTADLQLNYDESGYDPTRRVRAFLEGLSRAVPVLALEVQAPIGVLGKLLKVNQGIPLIRAQYERGSDGRLKVVGKDGDGRDQFKVIGYEQIDEVKLITHQL